MRKLEEGASLMCPESPDALPSGAGTRFCGRLVALAVGLLTFVMYLPALRNDFVRWDDPAYIIQNLNIRAINIPFAKWALLDLYRSNWHPLTWLSHALDYAFWGLNPAGHHLTNNVLHAVNSGLVVLIAQRLVSAWSDSGRPKGPAVSDTSHRSAIVAAVTGLLFGLHPLHVESVAWVSERKDLLCALFYLLSVLSYLNLARSEIRGSVFFSKHYLAVLASFALALMSKPMAVTLPMTLLILDWHPFNRVTSWKTLVRCTIEKLPLLALSAGSAALTLLAQKAAMGKVGPPFWVRLLVSPKNCIAYIQKMLLPADLLPFYPYSTDVRPLSMEYLLPPLIVAAITAGCISMARKQKFWLAAWLYYVMSLLPAIGLIQVGLQAMADRYTYLPSLGPFLIAGISAAFIVEKASGKRVPRFLLAGFGVVFFSVLSIATVRQIRIWHDSISLWTHEIEREPERVPLAYVNRADGYKEKKEFEKALSDFTAAVSLNRALHVYLDPAIFQEALKKRALLHEEMGRAEDALLDYVRLVKADPRSSVPLWDRARVYEKIGDRERAIADYRALVDRNPKDAEAHFNLGRSLSASGRNEEALSHLMEAVALNPDNASYRNFLGMAYARLERYDAAISHFEAAYRLNPGEPAYKENLDRALSYRSAHSQK